MDFKEIMKHRQRMPPIRSNPPESATLTMSAEEAARLLGTTPDKVRSAILNGTMPVGMVGKSDGSTHNRTIIIRRRFELWLKGELRT